jgi:hypothetical protein
MSRREPKEWTYNIRRRGNVQTWHEPVIEAPEQPCLQCKELHVQNSAFCSLYCTYLFQRAA